MQRQSSKPPYEKVFDGRLHPPTFAAIETTLYCNLSCHFCLQYQNGTTVTGPHMSPEIFERVSDQLFPHLERFQPTVSGEPLMSKGLDRVLEKARFMGVRAEYYTNGTLLTKKMIDLILPTAGKIIVSFDAARKDTYESLRRGASFDKVVGNLGDLVAAVRELPPGDRPALGLVCVLTAQNIAELAELVDLAADLGLDFVMANHVVPGTEQVQFESLYHHQSRAAQCIQEAVARALERQLPLSVQPLDQITASLATTQGLVDPHARDAAEQDGVVEALGAVGILQDLIPPWPQALPEDTAEDRSSALPLAAGEEMDLPDSIWTCEFLWNRLYVSHAGVVTPCCLPGPPYLGDLSRQDLDEIWNGDLERAMRIAMAKKDPAPYCKGCQHIREVNDPAEIAQLLGGQRLPASTVSLPLALRPVTAIPAELPDAGSKEVAVHVSTPTLCWPPPPGHGDREGYEVQLSLDGFENLAFTTDWHGMEVTETRFRIPEWVWELGEVGQVVHWRALALLERERPVVGSGVIVKQAPATQ